MKESEKALPPLKKVPMPNGRGGNAAKQPQTIVRPSAAEPIKVVSIFYTKLTS